MSKFYSREDLTRLFVGNCEMTVAMCQLCSGISLEGDDKQEIEHVRGCPLGYPPATGVTVSLCTAPHDDVCEACPASDRPCAVPDWREESHESLQKACGRYAVSVEGR